MDSHVMTQLEHTHFFHSFFFLTASKGSVSVSVSAHKKKKNKKHTKHLTQARCLASANTSAKVGVGPSTHTEAPPSSNELANARAAAHPNMALHLRFHADRARPPQEVGDTPCLGPSQIVEKLSRFSGETASDFSCEYDKPWSIALLETRSNAPDPVN